MELFVRVLSGNSRSMGRAKEAEEVNQSFKAAVETLTKLVEDKSSQVLYVKLCKVYDSSFPEEKTFMKNPSRERLKSNKELVLRLLNELHEIMGVEAVMGQMLEFLKRHGMEEILQSLLKLLQLLSPLLESNEDPEFTTDDVVNAIDFEWHSMSGKASPLFNAIASVTGSPGAAPMSAASARNSPSPAAAYRRAFSERSRILSPSHESAAKSAHQPKSAYQPKPALTTSASSQYPVNTTALNIPDLAAAEIEPSEQSKATPLYSLNTLRSDLQHERKSLEKSHRRTSSSLRKLFTEATESDEDGSVGASTRKSSSRRRTSSDMKFSDVVEPPGPLNPKLISRSIGVGEQVEEVVLPGGGPNISAEDRQLSLPRKRSSSPSSNYTSALSDDADADAVAVDFSDNHHRRSPPVSPSSCHTDDQTRLGGTQKHVDELGAAAAPPSEMENHSVNIEQEKFLSKDDAATSDYSSDKTPSSPRSIKGPPTIFIEEEVSKHSSVRANSTHDQSEKEDKPVDPQSSFHFFDQPSSNIDNSLSRINVDANDTRSKKKPRRIILVRKYSGCYFCCSKPHTQP